MTQRTYSLFTTAMGVAMLACPLTAFAIELPIRVSTWDVTPQEESVTIPVPASPVVDKVLLQIHNLRFGGQVSIRINGGAWKHIYNHTVEFPDYEQRHDGIGGINSTVRFYLDGTGILPGQDNTFSFRLNGTDGRTTVIRVIDIDLLDSSGSSILPPGTFTEEDPSLWLGPYTDQANIDAGKDLWWEKDRLVFDYISQRPIGASCADCHFDDGSDLTYFNFSNESIITRSQFHGMTEEEGKQVASYIRSIDLNLPGGMSAPGRPWNPPFQPGPGTDPLPGDSQLVKDQKAAAWMAGRGLDAVAESDAEIVSELLPDGTDFGSVAEVMDYRENLSVRDIRMTVQFPDWNAWLPDHAPEDMWPDDLMIDSVQPLRPGYLAGTRVNEGPQLIYERLHDDLENNGATFYSSAGNLNSRFGTFMQDIEKRWYGDMRMQQGGVDAGDDELYGLPSAPLIHPHVTRDDMRLSILKWRAMKALYLVRLHELEDVQDAPVGNYSPALVPEYDPDPLALPGITNRNWVWAHAPHIISTNFNHFEEQLYRTGKQESNQWYLVQLVANTGARKPAQMNVFLDWAYVKNHLLNSYDQTGHDYAVARIAFQIKMMQSRYTGKPTSGSPNGINNLFSNMGFSQRTLAPNFFYSDQKANRDLHVGIDRHVPDLWRKFFEEYLHEWLFIYESERVNRLPRGNSDRNVIETKDYVPAPWNQPIDLQATTGIFRLPNENFAQSTYRLLPLLQEDGVNEALLLDLARWLGKAYPKIQDDAEGGDWDAAGVTHWNDLLVSNHLYLEDFEDDENYNEIGRPSIKDGNYVNHGHVDPVSDVPRNGGGRYVGSRGLTADVERRGYEAVNIALNGKTRLKTSARTAFRDDDNAGHGDVSFRVNLTFDVGGKVTGPYVPLNPDLFNYKFQSHEAEIDAPVGASSITEIEVQWLRLGGSGGGTVYVDNIMLEDATPLVDVTAPLAPDFHNITIANGAHGIRVRFRENASNTDPYIGYNIYRWESGQTRDEAVRLNQTLHKRVYGQYFDDTVWPGTTYNYVVTAVDAAGNESADSQTRQLSLPAGVGATQPDLSWFSSYYAGSGQFQWYGSGNIDLLGYKVYRKAEGESVFTVLNPSESDLPLFFDDPTYIDGYRYEYYVNPVTTLGELDNSANPVIVLPGVPTVPDVSADSRLAHVPFDADVSDLDSNLTLTLQGGATVQAGTGQFGGGVCLTGGSQEAHIANHPDLNTGGPYLERTIALWFKVDSVTGRQMILEEGGVNAGLNIYLDGDMLHVGGWDPSNGWNGTWRTVSGVTTGEWHHVALVLDAVGAPAAPTAGQFFAYYDGVEFDVSNSIGMRLRAHTNGSAIGGLAGHSRYASGNAPGNMVGCIDDLGIWNRALRASEVAILATAGQAPELTPVESFREEYALAPDGSEDFDDLSENGLPNIFYFLFGMGDPGNISPPNLTVGANPEAGMPIIERSLNGAITFSYVRHLNQTEFDCLAKTSGDLLSWGDVDEPTTPIRPSSTTSTPLDDDYEIRHLHFENVSTRTFFTVVVESSN